MGDKILATQAPGPAAGKTGGKLFSYPLTLLEDSARNSITPSKDDNTPSLSVADLQDYILLPGGRLARRSLPKTSPGPSPASSRAPSIALDRAPSPHQNPQTQDPYPSQPQITSSPNDYIQLPGGRIARRAPAGNRSSSASFNPPKALMSGAPGAVAVASIRNLRISDEKSRKGSTKSKEQGSSTSKSKSSRSAAVAKSDISRPVNPSAERSPPPPTPGDVNRRSPTHEALSVPIAPAVLSFRDPYSESIFSAGNLVAIIWAYQPQTQDKFALERGDMIEIVSTWNDGGRRGGCRRTASMRGSRFDWGGDLGVFILGTGFNMVVRRPSYNSVFISFDYF